MLYSLYDFDFLLSEKSQEETVNTIRTYQKASLLDPPSQELCLSGALDFYKDPIVDRDLTVYKDFDFSRISETDFRLFLFCSNRNECFKNFGQIISCESFRILIDLLDTESADQMREGLFLKKQNELLSTSLEELSNETYIYREWFENPFFLKFLARKNFMKISKNTTLEEILEAHYEKKSQETTRERFSRCLSANDFEIADTIDVTFEEIDFSACKSIFSLSYALTRIENLSTIHVPKVYAEALKIADVKRFSKISTFFSSKKVAQESTQTQYKKEWISALESVLQNSDLETIEKFAKKFQTTSINLGIDKFHTFLLKRGSRFYLESKNVLAEIFERTELNTDIFLENLPYLQDSKLLREYLEDESFDITEENCRNMLLTNCSIHNSKKNVCDAKSNDNVGVNILSVILEFMENKGFEVDSSQLIDVALENGNVEMVKPLLDLSDNYNILDPEKYISKKEDSGYFRNDIDMLHLCMNFLTESSVEILTQTFARDVDDNPEALRILRSHHEINEALAAREAKEAENYKIIFYLFRIN